MHRVRLDNFSPVVDGSTDEASVAEENKNNFVPNRQSYKGAGVADNPEGVTEFNDVEIKTPVVEVANPSPPSQQVTSDIGNIPVDAGGLGADANPFFEGLEEAFTIDAVSPTNLLTAPLAESSDADIPQPQDFAPDAEPPADTEIEPEPTPDPDPVPPTISVEDFGDVLVFDGGLNNGNFVGVQSAEDLLKFDPSIVGPGGLGAIALVSFASNFTVSAPSAGLVSREITYGLELEVPEGTTLNANNLADQTAVLKSGTNDIYLFEVNGTIFGSISPTTVSGNEVFRTFIDSSTGLLTFEQFLPIQHVNSIDTTTSDAATILDRMLLADNQIQLTARVTDDYGSGQVLSATAFVDLGGNIQFGDDGPAEGTIATPTISAALLTSLNTGDGGLLDGNDKALPATVTSAALADTFTGAVTPDYGADIDAPPAEVTIDTAGNGFTFDLDTSSANANGAVDTQLTLSDGVGVAGTQVYAYLTNSGRTIVGRTADTGSTDGDSVFTLTIDQATGAITQTQNEAFAHSLITNGTGTVGVGTVPSGTYSTTPIDPATGDSGDSVDLGVLNISVSADVRTTDSDGDYVIQAVSTGDIADGFKFFDDGPAEGTIATPTISAALLTSLNTGDGGLLDGNDKALPATVTSAALADTFTGAVTPDYGADIDAPPAEVTIDTAGNGFTFDLDTSSANANGAVDTQLTLSDGVGVAGTQVYAYLTNSGRTIVGRTADTGSTDGDSVFTLTIDQATGAITQTQNEAFAHSLITNGTGTVGVGTVPSGTYSTTPIDPATGDSGDSVDLGVLNISVSADVRTTDSDGDYVIQAVSTGDIADGFKFFDDGPADFAPANATLDNDGSDEVTETLNPTALRPGADELGSLTFTGINNGDDALIKSGGNTVSYYLINNGTELIASTKTLAEWNSLSPTDQADPNAADYVFTITLDPSQSNYTVKEYATIDGTTDTTLNYDVKLTDEDLDFVDGDFEVTWAPSPAVLKVGENISDVASSTTPYKVDYDLVSKSDIIPTGSGTIEGTNGEDILIGDVGGGSLVNQSINLSLVLDVSRSMILSNINFNNASVTRFSALQTATKDLLSEIAQSGATAKVQIVKYSTEGSDVGYYNFTSGDDQTVLNQAFQDIDDLQAGGGTNYEAGLVTALNWISGGITSNTPLNVNQTDKDKVIFISDGEPSFYYRGNDTQEVNGPGNTFSQAAIDHIQGNYNGSGPDDTVDERLQIENQQFSIEAVGIATGNTATSRLSEVEIRGQATAITTGQQLEDVLGQLTGLDELNDVGNDVINGDDGDDLIFGDVTYTDDLIGNTVQNTAGVTVQVPSNNLVIGDGWKVFEALESQSDWDREDTVNYIRNNSDEVAKETVLNDGTTRSGGDDNISGGSGDDTIYGQEGDDTIAGDEGDDRIAGGTGDDTMTGGDGDDQFVFFKGQGRESTENAFFDNFDDRTQLSGSNWSQWTETGDNNPGDFGGRGNANTGLIKSAYRNGGPINSTAIEFDNADNNRSLTSDLITINQSQINQGGTVELSFDWNESAGGTTRYVEVYYVNQGGFETSSGFRVTGNSNSGSTTLDLTSYVASNSSFKVRFKSSGNWRDQDEIYFDNISIDIVNPISSIDVITDFNLPSQTGSDTIEIVGDNISGVSATNSGLTSSIGGIVYEINVSYTNQSDDIFYVDLPTGSLNGNITIAANSATLDGPIAGAQLFLDQDFDGSIDANELIGVTDANGEVAWQIPLADLDVNQDGIFTLGEARAVQTGGTDTETGLSYAINLFGPAAGNVITPLTSLLQARIENGDDRETAQSELQQALDLPSETAITSLNPMTSTAEVFATTAGVMTLAVQLAELSAVQQQISPAEVSFEVFTALSDQIVANGKDNSIQLADKALINDVAEQLGLDGIDANVLEFLSSSQLAIESSILNLTPDDNAVDAVSAVQVLTQGEYAGMLAQVANGELSSGALLDLTDNLNQIAEDNGLNSEAVQQAEAQTAAAYETQALSPEANEIDPDPTQTTGDELGNNEIDLLTTTIDSNTPVGDSSTAAEDSSTNLDQDTESNEGTPLTTTSTELTQSNELEEANDFSTEDLVGQYLESNPVEDDVIAEVYEMINSNLDSDIINSDIAIEDLSIGNEEYENELDIDVDLDMVIIDSMDEMPLDVAEDYSVLA
ncbi:S-layer family protein [Synechococcus sp. CC9311]|uniref:beta strand repeat-containing protein n=1 Tax=Synechococcus sp. (strain CC9311) TaxID=64471 RepID=UPI0000DDADB1|nr:DUF5801 repeats-in-toxin domain-containing protein [Synechococcus sp. CC9311]ABI45433.1 structural toxin protein RtxA [Synechococcus sp. CC9311]